MKVLEEEVDHLQRVEEIAPDGPSFSWNAARRACDFGSSGLRMRTPMRRIRSLCCALAASGHAAAAAWNLRELDA